MRALPEPRHAAERRRRRARVEHARRALRALGAHARCAAPGRQRAARARRRPRGSRCSSCSRRSSRSRAGDPAHVGPPGALPRPPRRPRPGGSSRCTSCARCAPTPSTRLGRLLRPASSTALTRGEHTRVGRVLRATQLDELPQLCNVLRGDMSIVGPRPIRPMFFEELVEDIPQYWQRLVVRPGLTGFAQLRMRRDTTWAEKLAHDLEYLADRSVALYMRIVLATAARRARARPRRAHACSARGALTDVRHLRARRPRRRSGRRGAAGGDERRARRTAGPTTPGRSSTARSPWPRGGWRSSTSPAADQPISTEDGRVHAVQNGEILNHAALRDEPRARRPPLRDALRHRGPRPPLRGARLQLCSSSLRGMFALAIWDAPRRRLLLARDRFGIKPLYWRAERRPLSFASELKALRRGRPASPTSSTPTPSRPSSRSTASPRR